jgi:transcriptional regulator GlxA family with amidase domain
MLLLLMLIWSPKLFAQTTSDRVRTAGFVVSEDVHNNDFLWSFDIFQHTFFPEADEYIRCVIITPDGEPFTTFEGIRLIPDYSFDNAPPIDILVIPGTKTSMEEDLHNTELINWIKKAEAQASYVVALGKGTYLLAITGVLEGRSAATYPPERKMFSNMFPQIRVRNLAVFVADGKYITGMGGNKSHEPALYLVEKLYSRRIARGIARGLALDWNLKKVPHVEIE